MSHHHQKTLDAVFAHPVSANIDFKDVEQMLTHLGATIEEKASNKIIVRMGTRSVTLHRPHQHSMPKDEVSLVRGFLIDCGIQAG